MITVAPADLFPPAQVLEPDSEEQRKIVKAGAAHLQ